MRAFKNFDEFSSYTGLKLGDACLIRRNDSKNQVCVLVTGFNDNPKNPCVFLGAFIHLYSHLKNFQIYDQAKNIWKILGVEDNPVQEKKINCVRFKVGSSYWGNHFDADYLVEARYKHPLTKQDFIVIDDVVYEIEKDEDSEFVRHENGEIFVFAKSCRD